ncbi:family 78 glycoside hydrolase catalytic domain [Mediterraneibacter glycyrrhizinilyticus]|uniref:family 78 glycoside hydrolase catalytic domain n=1 Tax=Mediterraneibacter glycyrrhizinilyticus TaxID=342942 RepID=UPI0019607682|nr:family 78 glycoside hydrolase catalytic domain [Mediterraneibacter glycyrrhizinilyticus]MBM6750567.1 family 78 glycoside hydrolase catalytic domain [Mediterraneibacter glycyrrhizinilyticus]
MSRIQLEIQNAWNGNGVTEEVILGWTYANRSEPQIQKYYRIIITKQDAIVYDSKWIESKKQNQISCIFDMEPNSLYFAEVKTEDTEGKKEKSDRVPFLTGINANEWKSDWISAGSKKPFIASKEFEVFDIPESAVISISGMGQFLAKINGTKIGNTVLDGAWTDYDKTVPYSVFNVTELVRMGRNRISIEVGNGWYIGDSSEGRHFYTKGEHGYHSFGPYLCCRAQMTIRFTGSETLQYIMTDSSWELLPSDVLMTNIYGSEDQDASRRVEADDFHDNENIKNVVVLQNGEIPKGVMRAATEPPIIIKKSYSPISAKKTSQGITYDFGQNMALVVEIHVSGKKGQKIRVSCAEKVDSHDVPVPSAHTYCVFTLSGNENDVFIPKFCYSAGRWVTVENAEEGELSGSGIKIHSVIGHFVSSGAEEKGDFKASDPRYKEIFNLILNAIDSNLNHVHTDCPTVEKLGWLETDHLMGPSIMFTRYVNTLWNKISADMRDAQYGPGEEDVDLNDSRLVYGGGLIPSIAPRYARFIHAGDAGSFWDIVPWGSSILLAAEWQRKFYGNDRIIKENYTAAVRYLDYLWQKYKDYRKIYRKEGNKNFLCHGLGDWGIEQGKGESRENIETAFLYKDLKILEDWSDILNKKEEKRKYHDLAEIVLDSYNRVLMKQDSDGRWFYDAYDSDQTKITQVNQAIPLDFGMVPADRIESVRESFIKTLHSGRINSGEIGLRYLFNQAAICGQQDKVHEMLMQEEHPSYYRFIRQGETTLPEFWRDDARSRNHDMMGQIIEWFFRQVAGIWSEDGYNTITITPKIPHQLDWVDCTYYSVTGMIRVYSCFSDGKAIIQVELPPNTIGIITCPRQKDYIWETPKKTVLGGGKIVIKGRKV